MIQLVVWAVAICNLQSAICHAQEIPWRFDYNAARREAQQKGLPLLIDFGTDNCFWCRKLEETTLRDPTVARLMCERFIPLKINADRDPTLAQLLHIQSYPTVVLAASDGKILGTMEGYQDAARFPENLQRALASVSNPEWMVRDFQEASRAMSASDYARAIALLRSIVEDGKSRPIQVKAGELIRTLEQQATDRLARAKKLIDGNKTTEALDTLTDLVRVFPGTQAALEAGQLLGAMAGTAELKQQQRQRRARELLAQAREDYQTQQFLCCLDRCDILTGSYGDLPEGAEALQLSNQIKNNPEWMQSACDRLGDRLGTLYLSLAEGWLKKGRTQQAMQCLEWVIRTLPNTRQAEAAQVRLTQLQGQPVLTPTTVRKQ
jgi:thioredoxin-related protein